MLRPAWSYIVAIKLVASLFVLMLTQIPIVYRLTHHILPAYPSKLESPTRSGSLFGEGPSVSYTRLAIPTGIASSLIVGPHGTYSRLLARLQW